EDCPAAATIDIAERAGNRAGNIRLASAVDSWLAPVTALRSRLDSADGSARAFLTGEASLLRSDGRLNPEPIHSYSLPPTRGSACAPISEKIVADEANLVVDKRALS